MAFTLAAIVGATTVILSDSNPFRLLSARGMMGAPARRVTAQGAAQHGDTDLGYRLTAREIELQIGFFAATDAALDAHRDTLTTIFKPLPNTPINLRVTRDDAEIRQLDCNVVGEIKIDWLPEHRPGHYHRATVKLRAPDPTYYAITTGTVTVTGAGTAVAADWYLAGGAIDSGQVMMSGGTPTQGLAWSYAGTIPGTSSFTLAMRMTYVPLVGGAGTTQYAYYVNNPTGTDAAFGVDNTQYHLDTSLSGLGSSVMTAGTQNYYTRYDYNTLPIDGLPTAARRLIARDSDSGRVSYTPVGATGTVHVTGTAGMWRRGPAGVSSNWPGTVVRYALYSPGLSETQLDTLGPFMEGAVGGTVQQSIVIPYAGDAPEYPIISVRGPITGLILNNVSTDDSIAFGTTVIAAGETYVLDTRPGYKTVTLGTVNKRDALATYSDWDEWHLRPNAPGGFNVVVAYGENTSGSTQISVVYRNRFASM